MSVSKKALGIEHLDVEARLSLVEKLWNSIAGDSAAAPLTRVQRAEHKRGLAGHEANPDDVVSWNDVRISINERLKKPVSPLPFGGPPSVSSSKRPNSMKSDATAPAPAPAPAPALQRKSTMPLNFSRNVQNASRRCARTFVALGPVVFPRSVFSRIEPHRIVVLTLFHAHRDRTLWQERTYWI